MRTHSLSFVKTRRKRLLVEVFAAVCLAIALPVGPGPVWAQTPGPQARVTEAVDPAKLVTLRGNVHPLARAEFDRGRASDDLPMERILLVLKRGPEQETALRHLLEEQQTKSSPNFHHWLTPTEFGQQFGPADADIQAVTSWLASEGFEVRSVAAGRTIIEFSGTAGLIREAFHTEIHQYDINGKARFANASDPMIPQALAPVVAGFDSLNSFPKKPMHRVLGTFRRSKATGETRPLFTFPIPGGFAYGVGPTDFATIYNILPLWAANTDGTNQTIAIVADSNINLSDVTSFRAMFGLPAYAACPAKPCLNVILNGSDPGLVSGSETEADLDVEWAGGVAKNATIDLVVSQDTEASFGADLSALYIIDNNLAPVLSVSFGECEFQLGNAGNAFYNALWGQGAAEGITILVSSGDSGSDTCDQGSALNEATNGLSVSGVASTPFNVAVGGTDFNQISTISTYWSGVNNTTSPPCPAGIVPCESSAISYIPEMPWNDSCAAPGFAGATPPSCPSPDPTFDLTGGGGGPSNCATQGPLGCLSGNAKPAWQTGTGVPADGARDLPDVSLFAADGANRSFYIICAVDQSVLNGGSNSSCDLNSPFLDFLGVGGTSASAPAFAGIMAMVNQAHGRQGNANYVLYPLAAKAGASCTSNAATASSPGSCIFYDTNPPSGSPNFNNSVACAGGTPNCSKTTAGGTGVLVVDPSAVPQVPAWTNNAGYDLATGVGTVNAANLVNHWTDATFSGTTTTLALSPTTITHGQNVTATIHVTSGLGTPTGAAALIASANSNPALSSTGIGPLTLTSGAFTGTTNMLPGGTYNVSARYVGDGKFGASDSTPPIAVTVSKESSQTTFRLIAFDALGNPSVQTSVPYGSAYVLRADIANSASQFCTTSAVACPNGNVTWTDNGSTPPLSYDQQAPAGTVAGSLKLNSEGYTEDQYIQFPGGAHTIVATYAGDNSFTGSTSAADALTITPAATQTTLTVDNANPASGALVTLTATISTNSSGVAPSKNVQFLNGTAPITGTPLYTQVNGTFATAAQLTATLQTSFTANASVTAVFNSNSSDLNYISTTSNAVAITVSGTGDYALSGTTPAAISPGQSAMSTITVTSSGGFSGTVSFTCAVSPVVSKGPGCSIPGTVTGSGSTTLTVTTTAPSAASPLLSPNWIITGGAAVLAGLLLLAMFPARKRPLKLALGLVASALLAAALVGCGGGGGGGGGGNPGTPKGPYTVTVTGTSGALSHQTQVTVTVQ